MNQLILGFMFLTLLAASYSLYQVIKIGRRMRKRSLLMNEIEGARTYQELEIIAKKLENL